MTLLQKQKLFAELVSWLLYQATQMGYEVTLGDAYRDPRVHGEYGEGRGYGHRKSNHKLRLAIDLNLFRDGAYLTNSEDHRPLGEWWEAQHELCRWGGPRDGNHYALIHNGMI